MGFQRNLKQDVTHWPVTGSDGFGGFAYGTPILLSGRWEDRNELFVDDHMEQVTSRAIVYLAIDVAAGDFLGQGDLTATNDPGTLSGTYRVRQYGKVTDLRNLQALRKVWL